MAKKDDVKKQWNVMAIIAVGTMWFPFAGLVLGIIAITQIRKTKERGIWLAITAIVLPILATISVAIGAYLLISHSIEQTREKASALGITTSEYNQINNAINGSCRLEAIETGQFDDEYSYSGIRNSSITKVVDDFAVGYRECYNTNLSESFIAKKDIPSFSDSTWRIIYTSPTLPCYLDKELNVPAEILEDCQIRDPLPVRAL
jgi:hypothetical protein